MLKNQISNTCLCPCFTTVLKTDVWQQVCTHVHKQFATVGWPHLSSPVWHRHIGLLILQWLGTPGLEGGCTGAQEGPRDCLPFMWRPEQVLHLLEITSHPICCHCKHECMCMCMSMCMHVYNNCSQRCSVWTHCVYVRRGRWWCMCDQTLLCAGTACEPKTVYYAEADNHM